MSINCPIHGPNATAIQFSNNGGVLHTFCFECYVEALHEVLGLQDLTPPALPLTPREELHADAEQAVTATEVVMKRDAAEAAQRRAAEQFSADQDALAAEIAAEVRAMDAKPDEVSQYFDRLIHDFEISE